LERSAGDGIELAEREPRWIRALLAYIRVGEESADAEEYPDGFLEC
jgi:hypothetical protein